MTIIFKFGNECNAAFAALLGANRNAQDGSRKGKRRARNRLRRDAKACPGCDQRLKRVQEHEGVDRKDGAKQRRNDVEHGIPDISEPVPLRQIER